MDNLSPVIVAKSLKQRQNRCSIESLYSSSQDEIDALELFDLIRDLRDPEHPLSLEELKVVSEDEIEVDNENKYVTVYFSPTVPHCSQATLIGLMVRSVLLWSLPHDYRCSVLVKAGSHSSTASINKQLADKERVYAALENVNVLSMIMKGVSRSRGIDSIIATNLAA